MKDKSTKKIRSKIKNTNQLELTFRENIKNKKNINKKIKFKILFITFFLVMKHLVFSYHFE